MRALGLLAGFAMLAPELLSSLVGIAVAIVLAVVTRLLPERAPAPDDVGQDTVAATQDRDSARGGARSDGVANPSPSAFGS